MTKAPLASTLLATSAPPVMDSRRWIEGREFTPNQPLINLSQAAPVDPPPEALREEMARLMGEPESHLYGPVLGLPALREAIAARWTRIYKGPIAVEDVAVTAGCNQAFCAAIATLAKAGENVILPAPWYFNHRMWLETTGVETIPLTCVNGMLPDPEAAEAAINPKTRAIVLVSPNNPTGAEYPSALLARFMAIARAHGIALVLDETYRDFHSLPGPPHTLFQNEDWRDNLIHLYSFSKVYRLTGHRVGAIVTAPDRLAQVEKFLDSMTICPPQIGQHAALYGLEHLDRFVAGERAEILARRDRIARGLRGLEGWTVLGCGAYFAYVEHPFVASSADLAPKFVDDLSLLILPGTMFTPPGFGGEQQFRIAFANADRLGLDETVRRLRVQGYTEPVRDDVDTSIR